MWVKIENPDTQEVHLIDLKRVESAHKHKDGSVTIWLSGTRSITFQRTSAGGNAPWVDQFWVQILQMSKMTEPDP